MRAHWVRLAVWTALLGATATVCAVLFVMFVFAIAYANLPPIDSLADYRPKIPLRIWSSDGVLLGEFGEERRSYVPIREVPQRLKDAILSAEDDSFYRHSGVDFLGLARAALANAISGRRGQGGSTITMQVARNFYLSSERSYLRKLYEIALAYKIESSLPKDRILEVYINQIFLGQRAYGFAAAAQTYFGKPLGDLTLGECAMLAGLPAAPSAYNPNANLHRARVRERYVLSRMLVLGHISKADFDQAVSSELKVRGAEATAITNLTHSRVRAEYVAELARQLVFDVFRDETYTRGLNVYTTISSGDQQVAYDALRATGAVNRSAARGPRARAAHRRSPGRGAGDRRPSCGDRAGSIGQAGARDVCRRADREGRGRWPALCGRLAFAPDAGGAPDRARRADPAGARRQGLLGHHPDSAGRIGFRRVRCARRSGARLRRRIRLQPEQVRPRDPGVAPTRLQHQAVHLRGGARKGIDDQHAGERRAADDRSGANRRTGVGPEELPIRVLQQIGPQYAQQCLSRFGFDPERHPAYLTMALGAGSVTPWQELGAYGVFANGGFEITPYLITRIADAGGKVLMEASPRIAGDSALRVIDASTAFIMDSLLRDVARYGTGARASSLGRSDVAGKTGTTNDSHDAWFSGYGGGIVGVAWIGFDQPHNLGERETGGGLALPIWLEYMGSALKGQAIVDREPPPGVVTIDGEYYLQQFQPGQGVASLGVDDAQPPEQAKHSENVF